MIYIFYITCHFILAACCQNNSASEEETEVLEECEFPDFTPFVARFRIYKRDLSETNKVVFMSYGMESLKGSVYMKGLVERMCNYERDLALVETEFWPTRSNGCGIQLYRSLFPIIPYIF